MKTEVSDKIIFVLAIPFMFWFFTYPIVLWILWNSDVDMWLVCLWGLPGIMLFGMPFVGPLLLLLILKDIVFEGSL